MIKGSRKISGFYRMIDFGNNGTDPRNLNVTELKDKNSSFCWAFFDKAVMFVFLHRISVV
jgi:hypothetical protein